MRRKNREGEDFRFEGFSSPNTTPVPDEFFDVLAPRLTESELRVLLYIIRRTFGFKKRADAISLKQLVEGIKTKDGTVLDVGTGMSKRGVLLGVQGLVNKGIIEVRRAMTEDGRHEMNVYSLRFKSDAQHEGNDCKGNRNQGGGYPGVVYEGNYHSHRRIPPVVYDGDPQETVLQQTVLQETTTTGPPPPGTNVVASSSSPTNQSTPSDELFTEGEKQTSESRQEAEEVVQALRELGVHAKTARRVVRENDIQWLRELVDFVTWRLEHGWRPEVSAAAWIVAAVRDRYEVPQAFRQATKACQSQNDTAGRELRRMKARLEKQRHERMKALGMTQEDQQLWSGVIHALKQEGRWRPVLAAALLRKGAGNRYELIVPWRQLVSKARGSIRDVAEALQGLVGERVEVDIVVETERGR